MKTPATKKEKMLMASTVISETTNEKVVAFMREQDRTRGYTLRKAIEFWAAKQPASKTRH